MDIFESARKNNIEALKANLQDTPVDERDTRGSTPLILAAYYQHPEAVTLLLESGADPELQDGMGNTALMGVCFKGCTEIARILLEHGANVDTVNGNGATALTFAATFGHKDLVQLLLEYGANPYVQDRFGKNPIDHAMIQENAECYEMLVASLQTSKSSN
ncbi:ankyrin repeat domain-containing protein [Siphonobacter sp. SORGH_AS_0500]|uniref:ankyrin repeat domain-containing protein n=1 Tax=Siphonobacter sp. SORGH_AS_0500 TaxID=1864824 RepID=UPI00285EB3FD|nr:ankyrin repeat domain-containing protein [Siphonobacter sp. SORGH_AS_0500]MDR6197201.1 ankyrin repeat protein [Siphonobacter sp. SORGH_AS_0500]